MFTGIGSHSLRRGKRGGRRANSPVEFRSSDSDAVWKFGLFGAFVCTEDPSLAQRRFAALDSEVSGSP